MHGFTLIEMLIAIGILAMIAVLGWRSLDAMMRSRTALTDSMQQLRAMQRTFAQMQDDCAHLASITVVGNFMPVRIRQGRLSLLREVLAPDQPPRMQVVVYYLENGVLKRRESPATRDLPALEQLLQEDAEADAVEDVETAGAWDVALQSDVYGMALRVWNGGWSDQDATGMPPRGLEVRLQFGAGAGTVRRLFLLGGA